MNDKKISNKEIVLRQWFAARYGNSFPNSETWKLPKGIAELFREYSRDNPNLLVSFNFIMDKVRIIEQEVQETGGFRIYDEVYETEYVTNSDSFQKFEPAAGGTEPRHVVAAPTEVKLNICKLDDMQFPTFRQFPTGTVFDEICSDDPGYSGLMSGMVVICTGESGVGKSTLLIDVLSKMSKHAEYNGEEVNTLYISTEMTKTDLFFYVKKMPAIGKVNTLLISDYLKSGLKDAITLAMKSEEYDVILLDSYQDLVEKMQDILNWRAKEAENFLIQLMVEAAEELGKCIIAIQHLTKGGEYVGRTFLKHTTTAMLELKFDKAGQRFAMFTKNRRAGSRTHIPMYFTLKDGEVQFDDVAYRNALNANDLGASLSERQKAIQNSFGDLFSVAKRIGVDPEKLDVSDDAEFNITDDE